MDGVSGVIAIVTFSVQLIKSVQQANNFLKEVRDAPDEVKRLVDTLDSFEELLIAVDDQIKWQNEKDDLPSSVEILKRALERCRSTITTLETSVDTIKTSFDRRGRLHKTRASIQAIGKKDTVNGLREQIERDMSKLQLALSVNISSLQIHALEHIVQRPSQNTLIKHTTSTSCVDVNNLTDPGETIGSYQQSILITKERKIWQYRTILGVIRLRNTSKFLRSNGHDHQTALTEENCLSFAPYIFRTILELRYSTGFLQVPRSIISFPVFQDDCRFFRLCVPKNIELFKQAIGCREFSPLARDCNGWTFLHHAVLHDNNELCSLLIHLGVDVNHRDDLGDKASARLMSNDSSNAEIARTLLRGNTDIGLEDLDVVFQYSWSGSVETAELLLYTCGVSSNNDLVSSVGNSALMMALREFGNGRVQWKPFIQQLLRCNPDIHVSRLGSQRKPLSENPPWAYTTLDALFLGTSCPFEAEQTAQDWLDMLAEAGYDVKEYLEEMNALYSGHSRLRGLYGQYERHLVFHMDGNPSVGWEWWHDLSSPGGLVCHEFRNMNAQHETWFYNYGYYPWKETWPFFYPEWSDYHEPSMPTFPLYSNTLHQQRGEEEVQKPCQERRCIIASRFERQGRKKDPEYFKELDQQPMVPGAWIEFDDSGSN